MKKVWKWIIGIVIVLVVIGLVVGAVLLVLPRLKMAQAVRITNPNVQVPGPGKVPFNGNGQRGFPERGQGMMPFGRNGWGEQGWGMHQQGRMGFGMIPFGGLLAGLFSLGLLALVVLGIIWLVRKLSPSKQAPTPVAAAVPTRTCRNCGRPAQDEWKNCPYCGKKL